MLQSPDGNTGGGAWGAAHGLPRTLRLTSVGLVISADLGGSEEARRRGAEAPSRRNGCFALRRLGRAGLLVAVATAQLLCSSTTSSAAVSDPPPTPAAAGLPDGRVYEQVSPARKNGNQAGAAARGANAYGVSSPDGSRVLYWNSGPIGEATSGVDNFSVSARSPGGWSTRAALPQPPPAPRDPVSSNDPIWLMPSSNLTSVAFIARNPFTPVALNFSYPEFAFASTYLSSEGKPAVWLGEPTVPEPRPALEQLENPSNLVLVGAAADMSVVYYEYYGTLIPEDAPRRAVVEGGSSQAWGMYEWRDGRLKAAALLPPGEGEQEGKEDEDGAVAAGASVQPLSALPSDFDNQVSRSGNTLLFVSPSPESESGRPPQLYARLNGNRTVLISRSDVTGMPSLAGPDAITGLSTSHISSYAYGSPDGSHVLFASEEQLTANAPSETGLPPKEYEFNLATDTLSYLPGVVAPILASSEDGSTLVFDDAHLGEHELAVYSGGHVVDITTLPPPGEHLGQLYVVPVRLSADAKTLVFHTNAPIPGFNDGHGFGEIYRYDLTTNGLTCVSCPPQGQAPTGTANLSNDDLPHATLLTTGGRGISRDGSEIFFDTPDQLVPEDANKTRDVYEWHDGLLSLISAGTGTSESFFLDNSATGNDVFFATNADLSSLDTDGSFDVYDAREGGGLPSPPPSGCVTSCQPAASQPQSPPNLASTDFLGAGEQVSSVKPPAHGAPKPTLSRAQKLASSLKACKRKRGRSRRTCEALARRRYGKHLLRRKP